MLLNNAAVADLARPGGVLALANALLFLASDEASFVNGAEMAVGGGLTSYFGTEMRDWDVMVGA